jgi:putative CocE/NonD family hydrolase
MLHVGSWYDIANLDTPQYFRGLSESAVSAEARANQALFMGPWAHLLPYNQPTSGDTGDIDFGPEAAFPVLEMQREWFDHYLRDGKTGLPRARVALFVMGENRWREEDEWPLARADVLPLHLHSSAPANSAQGGGELSSIPPVAEDRPDSYVYDPDDPVPSAGGRTVGGGVADQRPKQSRDDVLVYTALAGDGELEITGDVAVRLFVSTDAPDTDFVAVLSDVYPDGFVQNLAEGVVRMRFRDSYDEPSLISPGEVYEIRIDLGNLSHVVLAGHRLRLHVTSSDFPRWDRNPNTGERLADATSVRKATQLVYHDASRPSAVLLPVVAR